MIGMDIPILEKEDVIEERKGEKKELNEDIKKDENAIFVVHEHDATRLHWDLRLEMEGVLKSWAVPKEPPVDEGIKRLAIQVDDHPLDYGNFEGEIPEGMYGAGTVKIWDKGKFILEEAKEDKLVFELEGKKLIGKYTLIRYKSRGEKSWLFFKIK